MHAALILDWTLRFNSLILKYSVISIETIGARFYSILVLKWPPEEVILKIEVLFPDFVCGVCRNLDFCYFVLIWW